MSISIYFLSYLLSFPTDLFSHRSIYFPAGGGGILLARVAYFWWVCMLLVDAFTYKPLDALPCMHPPDAPQDTYTPLDVNQMDATFWDATQVDAPTPVDRITECESIYSEPHSRILYGLQLVSCDIWNLKLHNMGPHVLVKGHPEVPM